MAVRIAGIELRPALLPTAVLVVGLPVLAGLGLWQLGRAAQKQALVEAHAARTGEPPIPLGRLSGPWEGLRARPVIATGRYDLEHQLLLDNRTHQGRAGYHVITPLRLAGGGAVAVNRGWVPVGDSRAHRPPLPGPDGEITLHATIALPPERGVRLGSAEEAPGGGAQVIQRIDLPAVETHLGYPLLPIVLLLDPQEGDGFVRHWRPVHGIGPDGHLAYALQWFAIAAVLLVTYVAMSTRRVE
jgi:surfeit locus 1 family protein